METNENEINERMTNDFNNELYDSQEYDNNPEKTEFITFNKEDNSFLRDQYIPNPTNEISPIKVSKSINMKPFHSIDNFHQNRFTDYNPHAYNINKNKYSNYSMPINRFYNDNNYNRNTYVNNSQDCSPYYYNNKAKYKKLNKSQIYNGNTTDDGDSYLNPNRESTFYNNNNQNMYLTNPVDYHIEEPLNNNNIDNSDEEQLIIYPEKKYIYVDEKYFSKKNNEGILRPKNLETYEVKSIEYILDDEYNKYKSISLGDYILKRGKFKTRKNKSCNNINYVKKDSEKEYEIKLLSNKAKDSINKKNMVKSDILSNIKLIKDKYDTKIGINNYKSMNNINIIKNTDNENSVEDYNKEEYNKTKGGIVDLSDKKKYTDRFIRLKYPNWKIVASACLIQSWFRSLKSFKNFYKKNLHKIIIIQKVYKMHYKNKILSNRINLNICKTYQKEPTDNFKNIYKTNKPIKYINNNKQLLPLYKRTFPIIYNSSSDEYYPRKNNLKIYNKPNINSNYLYKEINHQNETHIIHSNLNSRNYKNNKNNLFIVAILLMKKILENKLLKIYFDIISILKIYQKSEIKSDTGNKKNIKLHLEQIYIKKKENNFINKNEKRKENKINNNEFILNKNEKNGFAPNILLKDKKKIKNKHILFSNIFKYIIEKLRQERKRRKLIICFEIISKNELTNLKYALKKIKKYGKVRSDVLNNYASIIQNAFRYYLENKNKEGK